MARKSTIFAVAAVGCIAGASLAQVPDVLKSNTAKPSPPAAAPTPSAGASGKVSPTLPWEAGSPKPKDTKAPEVKPAPQPNPEAVNATHTPPTAPTPPKAPAPVPSFEKPAESLKDPKKPRASEKPKTAVKGDSSWADRMARANEEAIVLKQELENEELRRKINELRPASRQQAGAQPTAPVFEPDPVVRAVESSQGRMTATVEFGPQTRVVTEGMQVGRWKVESIRLAGVTMSDGRSRNQYPVRFPSTTPPSSAQSQPFLSPPSASAIVPPPPRVGGGAQQQVVSASARQSSR